MAKTASGDLLSLAKTILHDDAVSPLPSAADGKALTQQTLAGTEARQREFALGGVRNFVATTRQGGSGILAHIGTIEPGEFDALADWIQLPQYIVDDEVIGPLLDDNWDAQNLGAKALNQLMQLDIVQELVGELVDLGMELFSGVVEMVPVIGWLIGSAIEVGTTVSRAIQQQRADEFPELYAPMGFNGHEDASVYNQWVKKALNSRYTVEQGSTSYIDWTELFLPPGDPTAVTGLLSPFSRTLEQDLTASYAGREPLGLGIIPGSALLHQGIDIDRGGNVTDLGSFLPTSAQQAAWLWTRSQLNGPALFTLDGEKILTYWSLYLSRLRQYFAGEYQDNPLASVEFPKQSLCYKYLGKSRCVNSSGSKSGSRRYGLFTTQSDLNKIIDHYADPSLFGWADSNGKYRRRKSDDPSSPKYNQWQTWSAAPDDPQGIRESIPVLTAEKIRNRQYAALDTLTCAYVDERYLALAIDGNLRQHWLDRRSQLLQHPARCFVDLDAVPDWDGGIYRDHLIQAGVGGVACGPGGQIQANVPALPKYDVIPLPTGTQQKPARMPKRRGGGGAGIVVAAAAAAILLGRR